MNVNAQVDDSERAKYRIGITTGSFIPEENRGIDLVLSRYESFSGQYFILIQFYELPTESEKKLWALQGLRLTDYLPGNVYYAVIDSGFRMEELRDIMRAILPVDRRFKMETPLFFNGIPVHALERDGTARMTLSYYRPLDPEQVMNDLRARGVVIESHRSYSCQLDVTFNASRLEEITALPYVQFIGAIPDEPVLEEYGYRNSSGRANYLNSGYNGLNFNGQGETVAIGEGGVLNTSIDVKGRLVAELETGTSSHKIGVMQNCTGGGNEDPTNRNNCWGASVVSAPSAPDYVSLYTTYNVLYTNHSYGAGTSPSGGYDATARAHDLRIESYPNHIVIYSSGNSGTQTGYAPYAFPTWATITGAMKMSKNMLAIGALNPTDVLTDFSSRGPMYDGRIIPQVVIEGNEGTSYAAPKTTGIFAMLDQVYKSKNGGAVAPSGLVRAIVMNSADDLDNPGPDFKTGFGRINVRRAYEMIDESRFLSSSVSNGGSHSHVIAVPSNTKQMRVMIVWPDMAAAVNANPGIVNDLNLVATDPGNTSYNPWVLDASLPSNTNKLNTPAVRGIDNLNTMEQVTVDDPQSGNWTIQVSGYNVPSGPQTYYLTYEFLTDELHFISPLKDYKLQPGKTYHLRWDSYGGSGTFSLDYQLDGGSWVTIVSGYDASSRVYQWIAPFLTGIHTIKFRVRRGALTSEGDLNYISSIPENFRITKVCSDVVTLKWSPVNGATSYKVYRLGTMYMEEVTTNITFNGNLAVLTGQSTTGSEYYALSALTGTNEGQKTLAIEKVAGDYGCNTISWNGTISTNWFTNGNWSSGAIPTSSDNISIPSAPVNQPLIANTGAVCNHITIENGASLTMDNTTAYGLSVYGDWTNNGTFNRGVGTIDFAGTNSYQEIAGSSTTSFNVLKVSKGAANRILEATSLITLNAPSNPLVINSGIFKLSSASTITPFTDGAAADLSSSKGLWNNGGTINYGNFLWFNNGGLLRLSAGTINSGTGVGNHIVYLNNGKFIIEGGLLNIAGALRPNSGTSSGNYTQYGGTVTVCTAGSANTDRAAFEINSGVPFIWTGGHIVIQRASSNTTADVKISSATNTVTGGTLQIGNASTPASQTIRITNPLPVYNLVVNATNSPTARLVTNGLTVNHDVTISGGTLDANSLDLNIGGQWTNNGTFTPGTGLVTFNGSISQIIGGSSSTTFSDLTIDGTDVILGTTAVSKLTTVDNTLTVSEGKHLTIPGTQVLNVTGP